MEHVDLCVFACNVNDWKIAYFFSVFTPKSQTRCTPSIVTTPQSLKTYASAIPYASKKFNALTACKVCGHGIIDTSRSNPVSVKELPIQMSSFSPSSGKGYREPVCQNCCKVLNWTKSSQKVSYVVKLWTVSFSVNSFGL